MAARARGHALQQQLNLNHLYETAPPHVAQSHLAPGHAHEHLVVPYQCAVVASVMESKADGRGAEALRGPLHEAEAGATEDVDLETGAIRAV